MAFLFRWVVMALTILMIPQLVSGVYVDGFGTALAAALILSFFNLLLKPILILFTLPLTVLSLGFFIFFINAFLFKITGSFVSGFHVATFGSAFFAALILSLVSWVMSLSYEKREGRRVVRVRHYDKNKDSGKIIDI